MAGPILSFHLLLVSLACFAAAVNCTTIPKAASGWTMGRGSAYGVAKVRGLKPNLTTFSVKRVMRKTRAQLTGNEYIRIYRHF